MLVSRVAEVLTKNKVLLFFNIFVILPSQTRFIMHFQRQNIKTKDKTYNMTIPKLFVCKYPMKYGKINFLTIKHQLLLILRPENSKKSTFFVCYFRMNFIHLSIFFFLNLKHKYIFVTVFSGKLLLKYTQTIV